MEPIQRADGPNVAQEPRVEDLWPRGRWLVLEECLICRKIGKYSVSLCNSRSLPLEALLRMRFLCGLNPALFAFKAGVITTALRNHYKCKIEVEGQRESNEKIAMKYFRSYLVENERLFPHIQRGFSISKFLKYQKNITSCCKADPVLGTYMCTSICTTVTEWSIIPNPKILRWTDLSENIWQKLFKQKPKNFTLTKH